MTTAHISTSCFTGIGVSTSIFTAYWIILLRAHTILSCMGRKTYGSKPVERTGRRWSGLGRREGNWGRSRNLVAMPGNSEPRTAMTQKGQNRLKS